jgi:hypothetical protein
MKALLALCLVVVASACGPGRSTFARYPGSAPTFDRASQDPKALAIADKVLAAAGGDKWAAVKQIKWSESVTDNGKELIGGVQAWDRWNGRHHAKAVSPERSIVVMRDIYGDGGHAFVEGEHGSLHKIDNGTAEAVATAKERWQFDTAVLCLAFLLEEPGAKLEYVGETEGEPGKPADDIKLTFDPKDPTRGGVYHAMVDRETNQIVRIELIKAGKTEADRLGYHVASWVEAGGMKFPGTLENIGYKGEVITFKDVAIGAPDDTLYVPPIQ